MKKIGYSLVFLLVCANISFAQSKKYVQVFHEYYDDKPIHFGFQFGFVQARYFVSEPITPHIISPSNFGFFVGGNVNYAFNKYFEAKSGINVSLYERRILFGNAYENEKYRESTWIEFPFLMKFRSVRRKNHRAFINAGFKVGLESNKKDNTTGVNEFDGVNQTDFTIEYGFGLEIFNRFFKLSPEIRFSNGLVNLYDKENNLFGNNLNLKSNTISLILNFE